MSRRYFKGHKQVKPPAKPLEPCPLCKQDAELVQDHCHTSGFIRDRICNRCNVLLGIIENNPVRVDQLVDYIARWQWEHTHGGTPYRQPIAEQAPEQCGSSAI